MSRNHSGMKAVFSSSAQPRLSRSASLGEGAIQQELAVGAFQTAPPGSGSLNSGRIPQSTRMMTSLQFVPVRPVTEQAAPQPVRHSFYSENVNQTGMRESLKDRLEALSGVSLDDVRVHYNSSMPARVGALAFARGVDIHIGPGQEQYLPHEAWHVVQQKQGRVGPTMYVNGMGINDDGELEREADRMGRKAEAMHVVSPRTLAPNDAKLFLMPTTQCQGQRAIQRTKGKLQNNKEESYPDSEYIDLHPVDAHGKVSFWDNEYYYFYHGTYAQNLASIWEKGLDPSKGGEKLGARRYEGGMNSTDAKGLMKYATDPNIAVKYAEAPASHERKLDGRSGVLLQARVKKETVIGQFDQKGKFWRRERGGEDSPLSGRSINPKRLALNEKGGKGEDKYIYSVETNMLVEPKDIRVVGIFMPGYYESLGYDAVMSDSYSGPNGSNQFKSGTIKIIKTDEQGTQGVKEEIYEEFYVKTYFGK